MTRFRKWSLSIGIALALVLLPLATSASADPSDPGLGHLITPATETATGRGNGGKPITPTSDPSDPGLGP